MSRKELLELLQRRCAELGVDVRFRPLRQTSRNSKPTTTWCSPLTASTPQIRAKYADVFRPEPGSAGQTSSCGSAPTRSSRRSSSSSRTPSGAPCRSTATPTPTKGPRSSSKCTRTSGAAAGFDETADDVFPPGVSDEKAITKIRAIFAEELDGYEVLSNNSKWLNFTTVRNQSWRHGERRAARRRRAHRALLHRLRHQAGHGRLPGAGRMPARASGCSKPPSPPTRPSAVPWSTPPSVPPRRRWNGSSASASTRPEPHPVRFQPADPQPPHHPGKPQACATPSSRRRRPRLRGVPRPDGRRPGHVPAVPDRRAGTEEPHRGLAHGHVLRHWTASRATSTRFTSAPRPSAAQAW